jgi:hypothetical protein
MGASPRMSDTALLNAYKEIFLLDLRDKIGRDERNARIVALRETLAAGLSFEERDALATQAAEWAREVADEVFFSPSRKWQ